MTSNVGDGLDEAIAHARHEYIEVEHKLIDGIARFANSFSTGREISDFTHELASGRDMIDGQIIDYVETAKQVAKSMRSRRPMLTFLRAN